MTTKNIRRKKQVRKGGVTKWKMKLNIKGLLPIIIWWLLYLIHTTRVLVGQFNETFVKTLTLIKKIWGSFLLKFWQYLMTVFLFY